MTVRFARSWLVFAASCLPVFLLALLATCSAADPLPRLLILNVDGLKQTKDRLQKNDSTFTPLFARLRREADHALHIKPVSVTDKKLFSPSGNQHDYMSVAPYWWPNPSTPNGLPYIRRDGEVNPERDQTSDRQRIEKMIQAVETLSLGYYFFGRADYAAHAATILRAWFLDPGTKMNPHLKYAQAVPGQSTGRGAGIIETHGLAALIDFVSLLNGSKAWPRRDDQQWQDWVRSFVSWVVESPEGRAEAKAQNNHGTWYDVQVAALAIFTGRDDLAKKVIGEFPIKRIETQIQADGRQPRELARTRAWDYAIFNLEAMFNAASIADKLGIDLWNYRSDKRVSIRGALDWLVPFATGENQWSYQQITRFQPEKLGPLLRRASIAYGDSAYEQPIRKLSRLKNSERWELLYTKTGELK